MKFPLLLLFLLASPPAIAAATVPGTDIWLVDLDVSAGGVDAVNPRNLTPRPGYDNQPGFVTAHSFLFASMDASGQTDPWRYELSDGTAKPLLTTLESEYSPSPVPGGGVSVVRVAADGVQQLWTLAPGAEDYEPLFPLLEGIGYHAWVDERRVALFLVREPSELHIADRESGQVIVLARNVGRCLQPVPGSEVAIAFTEPGQDGRRWIKQYDLASKQLLSLAPVLEGSEDFAFLPDGRLLMAQGKGLFTWNGKAWQEVARYESLPGPISRLAVGPQAERLLMVVAE